jgi:hypothetical protein
MLWHIPALSMTVINYANKLLRCCEMNRNHGFFQKAF